MKHTGKSSGVIAEKSSFLCRCLCMPNIRTSESKISYANKEFIAKKKFRCGYCIGWLCCSRPDVIVSKDGIIIGSVV